MSGAGAGAAGDGAPGASGTPAGSDGGGSGVGLSAASDAACAGRAPGVLRKGGALGLGPRGGRALPPRHRPPAPLGTPGASGRAGGLHPAPAPGSPPGRKAGRPGPGRRGLGVGTVRRQHPVPGHRADGAPRIPVTVGFIYPPPSTPRSTALRAAWPGRGGRPGGRGVEGRRGVRCSRGRESFLLGPNRGLPSLPGAPVLAPGTPEGVGESTRLARNSLPVPVRFKVLRPCTPRPRPTPLPEIPGGAANSSPFPKSSGPGEKPSLPVWKSFQGIFLSFIS